MVTDIRQSLSYKIIKPFAKLVFSRKTFDRPNSVPLDQRLLAVKEKLQTSQKIVDLGCGNNPVAGACVGVDLYVEPKERIVGGGPGAEIDIDKFKQLNVTFVNARIDAPLPFEDNEFDFAYSHHVFEHVEDPLTACREMMRIAKSGVIITPSIFAEFIFGRSYHRWMVMDRANTLLFFRKRLFEDKPFGEHPRWDKRKQRWMADEETNPFEILLNDGNWYSGHERLPRLANTIRKHWNSRSPLIEMIFLWENGFEVEVYE